MTFRPSVRLLWPRLTRSDLSRRQRHQRGSYGVRRRALTSSVRSAALAKCRPAVGPGG
jgi:hypothetical protein